MYKCYLLSLNQLKGCDYNGAVWAVEDIDFNKRLVCDCFLPMLRGEGQLCLATDKTPPKTCASFLAEQTTEVLCKIRRFGFYGKRSKGGASGTSEEPAQKAKRNQPAPPPAPLLADSSELSLLQFLEQITSMTDPACIHSKLVSGGAKTLADLRQVQSTTGEAVS